MSKALKMQGKNRLAPLIKNQLADRLARVAPIAPARPKTPGGPPPRPSLYAPLSDPIQHFGHPGAGK